MTAIERGTEIDGGRWVGVSRNRVEWVCIGTDLDFRKMCEQFDRYFAPLPKAVDEVESDCCHAECSRALFDEIVQVGSWDVEDLCLKVERADDERADRGDRQ